MAILSTAVYHSIGDVDSNQWNHVVDQSPHGTVYQRTPWLEAVEACPSVVPRHVVVEKEENPVGVLPNFLVDLRLPDGVTRRLPDPISDRLAELVSARPGFGGPVLHGDEGAVLERALDAIEAACPRRALAHTIRCPDSTYVRYAEHLERRGYSARVDRCRFTLDITRPYNDILDGMDKDRRYNLRKAREMDATVDVVEQSADALRDFYERYEATMDRVGSDTRSRSFFRQLTGLDAVRLVRATVDGDVVGYHLYLLDDDQETIRHEFSGVRADDFEYYPSELIHEWTIKWGRELGYRTYDFGPTPSDHDDGLFQYKAQYGGTPRPILTWEAGQSPLWGPYRFGRGWYKRSGDGQ